MIYAIISIVIAIFYDIEKCIFIFFYYLKIILIAKNNNILKNYKCHILCNCSYLFYNKIIIYKYNNTITKLKDTNNKNKLKEIPCDMFKYFLTAFYVIFL